MRADSSFWKMVATGALSMLVTLAVAWFTLGNKAITAATVSSMIQTESPYVKDKRVVEEALSEIKALRRDFAVMQADVAKIEERTRK